ncbi:hypothetical protein PLICRDRAFT_55732 [Plicaturopsis crispa FD-325 SS-3]|nr:hypothetical protein PLICRDRAFT_55732 [Plicaturopsis crispa FD-325 SS-3]
MPAPTRNVSSPATAAYLVRHRDYYLPSGDVTFLVGETLFKIHKFFFERDSSHFRGLTNPASPGRTPIGTSDSEAYKLDNVNADEFARFLWIFYNPKYDEYEAAYNDWVTILRLAHDWQFIEVKAFAVRRLEMIPDLDDIQKIVLYRTYQVDDKYLIPSFAALCSRQAILSIAEAKQLDLETVIQIMRARECARSRPDGGLFSPTAAVLDTVDMQQVVCDVFQITPPTPSAATAPKPLVNGADSSTAPAPSAPVIDIPNSDKHGSAASTLSKSQQKKIDEKAKKEKEKENAEKERMEKKAKAEEKAKADKAAEDKSKGAESNGYSAYAGLWNR